MLQAVVLPGKNPLPAEVRIKRHETKGEEFYNVNQWKWYTDVMPSKDYEDPVQIQVRKLLNRAMVHTFSLFEFKYDELINKLMPVLPMPHDDCIDRVIQIIKGSQSVSLLEMNLEIAALEKTDPDSVTEKKDIAGRFTDTCAPEMQLQQVL